MSVRFELYKISQEKWTGTSGDAASDKYYIHRMVTEAFESLNINLSSPVSPMPLPENVSESNMLVKMEGNTKTVRFAFKFSDELVELKRESNLDYEVSGSDRQLVHGDDKLLDIEHYRDASNNPQDFWTGSAISYPNNPEKINHFLELFENFSITDTFIVQLYDTTTSKPVIKMGGTITGLDLTVDASSPVVWNCNLDFIVGDVISIYDSDTPDAVNDFTTSFSGSGYPKNVDISWTAPDRVGGTALTKYVIVAQNENDIETRKTWEILAADFASKWSSSNNRYEFTINSSADPSNSGFTQDSQWMFYMYAKNTGGRGTDSDQMHVYFT